MRSEVVLGLRLQAAGTTLASILKNFKTIFTESPDSRIPMEKTSSPMVAASIIPPQVHNTARHRDNSGNYSPTSLLATMQVFPMESNYAKGLAKKSQFGIHLPLAM